jgi:hypothetical protein
LEEYDDMISLYDSISENETVMFSFSSESENVDTFVHIADEPRPSNNEVTMVNVEKDDINTLLNAIHTIHTHPTEEIESTPTVT